MTWAAQSKDSQTWRRAQDSNGTYWDSYATFWDLSSTTGVYQTTWDGTTETWTAQSASGETWIVQ